MVEQAHFGTTRYTTLSLWVIHVPGNPMIAALANLPCPIQDLLLFVVIKQDYYGFINA
jgi:hypothetical protein